MKTTNSIIAVFLLISLSACSIDPGTVELAVSQTRHASEDIKPTNTHATVIVTTNTPSVYPTLTIPATSTPDNRSFESAAEEYVCLVDDLPIEYDFYIPSYKGVHAGPETNQQTYYVFDVIKKKDFATQIGLQTFWWQTFRKRSIDPTYPGRFGCSVAVFKDQNSAEVAVSDYLIPSGKFVTEVTSVFNAPGSSKMYYDAYYDTEANHHEIYTLVVSQRNIVYLVYGYAIDEEEIQPQMISKFLESAIERNNSKLK